MAVSRGVRSLHFSVFPELCHKKSFFLHFDGHVEKVFAVVSNLVLHVVHYLLCYSPLCLPLHILYILTFVAFHDSPLHQAALFIAFLLFSARGAVVAGVQSQDIRFDSFIIFQNSTHLHLIYLKKRLPAQTMIATNLGRSLLCLLLDSWLQFVSLSEVF